MLSRMKHVCSSMPCVLAAFVLTFGGGLLAVYWASIYDFLLQSSLQLTPGAPRFQPWKDAPVPIYIEFYFFNWTNPDELQEEGKKPRFTEIGPYRFKETKEKTDIVWNNNNNTVSFKMLRRWYFDPENSNGSLSDELTTINMVALSAAYVLRDWNRFLLYPFSQILKSHPLAITHNISEYLFEGFDDSLLKLGKLGSVFDKAIRMPYDKFGWFYKRNGSLDVDGSFNMATGYEDMSEMGELREWNHENWTSYYPDSCGRVRGSIGDVFPPHRRKGESVEIYSQDLCRPMLFDYSNEALVADVKTYEYTASLMNVDNGTLDPVNSCYCGGECVPFGLVNVSECKFGAPTFVSYPHFYQADPYYLEQVDGLKPDKTKHGFQIYIEPRTGVPLDLLARLQVNLLIQPYKSLAPFAKLPKIFFPMLWFEQRATVTSDLATALNMLLSLKTVGFVFAVALSAIGLTMFLAMVIVHFHKTNRPNATKKRSTVLLLSNTEMVSPMMSDYRCTPLQDITTAYTDNESNNAALTSKSKIYRIRKKIARPVIQKINN